MRSFRVGAEEGASIVVLRARVTLSACGDGFFTMLPAPGRSDRPVRPGVVGREDFAGEVARGMRLGMFDVGRAVMTTSSGRSPLVFGRGRSVPSVLDRPRSGRGS